MPIVKSDLQEILDNYRNNVGHFRQHAAKMPSWFTKLTVQSTSTGIANLQQIMTDEEITADEDITLRIIEVMEARLDKNTHNDNHPFRPGQENHRGYTRKPAKATNQAFIALKDLIVEKWSGVDENCFRLKAFSAVAQLKNAAVQMKVDKSIAPLGVKAESITVEFMQEHWQEIIVTMEGRVLHLPRIEELLAEGNGPELSVAEQTEVQEAIANYQARTAPLIPL